MADKGKRYRLLTALKNYKWRSVFFKYMLLVLFVIVLISGIVLVVISHYQNNRFYENITLYLSQKTYATRNTMDSFFAEMTSARKKLEMSPEVRRFLDASDASSAEAAAADCQKLMESYQDKLDGVVKSMYMYNEKADYVVSTVSVYKSGPAVSFMDNSWKDRASLDENRIFFRRHSDYGIFSKCISVTNPVRTEDGRGCIVFNMHYDMMSMIEKGIDLAGSVIYVVNSDGEVIYSGNDHLLDQNISKYDDIYSGFNAAKENNYLHSFLGKNAIITSIRQKNIPMYIIVETMKDNAVGTLRRNTGTFVFICILVFLVSFLLAIVLAAWFYGYIYSLMQLLPEDKSGKDGGKGMNELSEINQKIIGILTNKSDMELELTENLARLQKSQLIALQAQFNPHFLFNTLQLINGAVLARMKTDTEITRIIALLSDLLRVSLDTSEYICTLRQELENAEKYLELQNIKYDNSVYITWDIAPETLDMQVVKLCMQPLLENAIKYGMDCDTMSIGISISTHVEENRWILRIADNGTGIENERLEEIREKIRSPLLEQVGSIGLQNTAQRIQLIFGDEYGLEISSEGTGTVIDLKYPILHTGDND
ncbi:MAG: histidine kinase [Clostridia bacterium]|nr:histidine kinase [Clostridia bacterium]